MIDRKRRNSKLKKSKGIFVGVRDPESDVTKFKDRICEECEIKPARGSIGKFTDPTYSLWVCKECYDVVMKRSTTKEKELLDDIDL